MIRHQMEHIVRLFLPSLSLSRIDTVEVPMSPLVAWLLLALLACLLLLLLLRRQTQTTTAKKISSSDGCKASEKLQCSRTDPSQCPDPHGCNHDQDSIMIAQTTTSNRSQTVRVERRAYSSRMDVQGRISVSPGPEWDEIRTKSLSSEDMRGVLDNLKSGQRANAVVDTLAALVYDVNATAEVLRRGSLKRRKKPTAEAEVEYRLRITPQPEEEVSSFPSPKPVDTTDEDVFTLERVSSEYGVNVIDEASSLKKRARSETPRRLIQIEGTPPPAVLPICAFCNEEVEGPCITALAPNSVRAQKFHPHHFCCMYCLKALNLRGTYREHDQKPYCHECFYRLYSGLIYSPDEKQKVIQKLI